MKILIAVATHKQYHFPQDDMYLPVQAGRAVSKVLPQYCGDDTGDNISEKNKNYCELTVLYWAWKNLEADCIGICHYRRYFAEKRTGPIFNRILRKNKAEALLKTNDAILPCRRRYWIETNYSQYVHAHHRQDLELTRQIIAEDYPEYIPAFERYMNQISGHHFNMFIMKRSILNSYCKWLFEILSKLENRLDISSYDERNQRVFGYVGERLIDTWLDTNGISYTELPVAYTESQHWIKKGTLFVWRKIHGERIRSVRKP